MSANQKVDAMYPGDDLIECTKSDDTPDPNGPFRSFLMNLEGDLKVTTLAGTDRTYPSGTFAAQTEYHLQFTRVWVTGTGAQLVYGYK